MEGFVKQFVSKRQLTTDNWQLNGDINFTQIPTYDNNPLWPFPTPPPPPTYDTQPTFTLGDQTVATTQFVYNQAEGQKVLTEKKLDCFLDNYFTQSFQQTSSQNPTAFSSSLDGKCCTAISGSYIIVTSDSGKNWTVIDSLQDNILTLNCVAVSSSGQFQIIGGVESADGGLDLFVSNDFGQTWKSVSTTTVGACFTSVAMSSTGQYQIAVTRDNGDHYAYSGQVFTSNDYGNTWNLLTDSAIDISDPFYYYSKVAVSEDGTYYAVVVSSTTLEDTIYSSNQFPTNISDFTSLAADQIPFGITSFQGCVGFQFVNGNIFIYANSNGEIILSSSNAVGPFAYPGTNNFLKQYVNNVGYIQSFSCSYDTSIAVACGNQAIYLSGDLFDTFSNRDFIQSICINCCPDGRKIFGSSQDGLSVLNSSQTEPDTILLVSTDTWSNVAVSSCGNIQYIIETTQGILYKSVNAGKSWSCVNPLQGYSFIEFIGEYLVALGTNILISSDGGNTWNNDVMVNSSPQSTYTPLAIVSTDELFYFATATTIYMSLDFGKNWTSLSAVFTNFTSFKASRNGKTLAIIYNSDQILVSRTYGNTWFTPNFPVGYPNSEIFSSVGISGNGNLLMISSSSRVYCSNDSGQNFYLLSNVAGYDQIEISETGKIQIALKNRLIYTSGDYGGLWSNSINIDNIAQSINTYSSIRMSNNGKYCTVCSPTSVISTSDSGMNFYTTNYYNLEETNYIYSCQSKDGKYITLISQAGYIHRSEDYGKTWEWKNIQLYDSDDNLIGNQDGNPETYFQCAMSADGRIQVTVNNGISVSSDYGKSWYQSSIGYGNIRAVAISGNGAFIVALSINGNMFSSSDYGNNFSYSTSLQAGDDGFSYNWIACSSDFKYQVALGYQTYIVLSSDFGSTWTTGINIDYNSQGFNSWVNVVISADGNTMFANTSDGTIYKSSDFGVDWNTVTGGTSGLSNFVGQIGNLGLTYDATVLYIVLQTDTNRGIYFSINDGSNWTLLRNINQPEMNQISISSFAGILAMVGSKSCYIVRGVGYFENVKGLFQGLNRVVMGISGDGRIRTAFSNNDQKLYTSYDYGQNWTTPGGTIYNVSKICICQSGQYQMVLTSNGTHISSDYGQTFSLGNNYSNLTTCAISKCGTFMVVGGYSFISYSTDYGNDWNVFGEFTNICYDMCVSDLSKDNYNYDGTCVMFTTNMGVNYLHFSNNYQYILGIPGQFIDNDILGFASPLSLTIASSNDNEYIISPVKSGLAHKYNKCLNLWEDICDLPIANWTSVYVSQSGMHQILVSTDMGIWYTQDFGKSWNVKIFGTVNTTFDTVVASANCECVVLTGSHGNAIIWNYNTNTQCESASINLPSG